MGGTIVRYALVAGVLIALSPSLAQAQTADDLSALRKDIDALKEGQAALTELQQIKNLLECAPPAPRAGRRPGSGPDVGDGPSKGKKRRKTHAGRVHRLPVTLLQPVRP